MASKVGLFAIHSSGTNLEDGPSVKVPYFTAITDAVKQGKLNESVVREAVKPLFYTRMRLGLFDPPQMNPFSQLNVSKYVQCKEHRELAITSALKTFVLIKNQDNLLPVQRARSGKPLKKLAVRHFNTLVFWPVIDYCIIEKMYLVITCVSWEIHIPR